MKSYQDEVTTAISAIGGKLRLKRNQGPITIHVMFGVNRGVKNTWTNPLIEKNEPSPGYGQNQPVRE